MGVTNYDIELIKKHVKHRNIKSVMEFGAQNNYAQPNLPAPYMSDWYQSEFGIMMRNGTSDGYSSVDLNGENGSYKIDLSEPWPRDFVYDTESNLDRRSDLVTDFGTSEHVGTNGQFDWKAIYNCWKNKFVICKRNGIIISENPMTGNWPGHGFNYYTHLFYQQLEAQADLRILELTSEAATGNVNDGWNVVCVMQRFDDTFPPFETFKLFDLRQE